MIKIYGPRKLQMDPRLDFAFPERVVEAERIKAAELANLARVQAEELARASKATSTAPSETGAAPENETDAMPPAVVPIPQEAAVRRSLHAWCDDLLIVRRTTAGSPHAERLDLQPGRRSR